MQISNFHYRFNFFHFIAEALSCISYSNCPTTLVLLRSAALLGGGYLAIIAAQSFISLKIPQRKNEYRWSYPPFYFKSALNSERVYKSLNLKMRLQTYLEQRVLLG